MGKPLSFLIQTLSKMLESPLPHYRSIKNERSKMLKRLISFIKFLFLLFPFSCNFHSGFFLIFVFFGSALVWGYAFRERLPKGLKLTENSCSLTWNSLHQFSQENVSFWTCVYTYIHTEIHSSDLLITIVQKNYGAQLFDQNPMIFYWNLNTPVLT